MNVESRRLYFDGCPNIESARENLREALSQSGLNLSWEELDLQSENAPAALRGFPSPTILINGKEVISNGEESFGCIACRVGGVPSVEAIAAKLAYCPWISPVGYG